MSLRTLDCLHVQDGTLPVVDSRRVTMRSGVVTALLMARLCAGCADCLTLGGKVPVERIKGRTEHDGTQALYVWLAADKALPPLPPKVKPERKPADPYSQTPYRDIVIPRKPGPERNAAIAGLALALQKGEIKPGEFRRAMRTALREGVTQ